MILTKKTRYKVHNAPVKQRTTDFTETCLPSKRSNDQYNTFVANEEE